ncbi:hypothetical protein SteCoe_11402 [Stentor coeruleus]|uniref:Protein kinase domain-containing protein n=1 Tax=Stentor coeruleus TaxID=5963 RepID=A0A1R2CD79_9CILI|nr:hypothetical protein SteCoe_11402 [Stentor coeruleus]
MSLSICSQKSYETSQSTECSFTCLEDYSLGRVIGKGTFGKVVIAQHKNSGTIYAIKCVKKAKITTQSTYNLLKNEKSILSMIQSPFIVRYFGCFQNVDYIYLVQEYIPGGELFRLLQTRRKLSLAYVKFYSAEIVSAFMHLHSQHIIYRDLKPENILISASGHVKLVDFGFATVLKESHKCSTFCGTFEYLAPEMIERRGHDYSLDWWTLGVLIYELLVGMTPFRSLNTTGIFDKILKKQPDFPPNFDEDAKDLVCKLLEKNPKLRLSGEGIKKHHFFKDTDWNAVDKLNSQPLWIPIVRSELDTSNYEIYQDSPKNFVRQTHFSFTDF